METETEYVLYKDWKAAADLQGGMDEVEFDVASPDLEDGTVHPAVVALRNGSVVQDAEIAHMFHDDHQDCIILRIKVDDIDYVLAMMYWANPSTLFLLGRSIGNAQYSAEFVSHFS